MIFKFNITPLHPSPYVALWRLHNNRTPMCQKVKCYKEKKVFLLKFNLNKKKCSIFTEANKVETTK